MTRYLEKIISKYIDILLSLLDPLGSIAPLAGAAITISLAALITEPLLNVSQLAQNLYQAISTIILLLGFVSTIEKIIDG